jgi:hypothetical protein
MAASDATPNPIKNQAYRVTFPILDADGDLVTGATSPDSEVSKDAGTFADCTNEAVEIATNSGMYYLDLTASEMNADTVVVIVKSGNGKTTPIVLYPVQLTVPMLGVNVEQWNNTNVPSEHTAGYPIVTVKDGTGTGELDTLSGVVLAKDHAGANLATASALSTLSGIFTGITSLAQWLGLIAGKQTGNSTARTELRATGAGSGTYDETTDSQEASRDRGDAAWITATGFSTHSAADVWASATRTLTSISDSSGVTTLLSRLSATRAGYLDNLSAGAVALEASVQTAISKLLKYVQLILRKDAAIATDNATELTAINADGGSGAGAYANTTDALEAQRDNMGNSGAALSLAKGTNITGFNDLSAAQVNTEADAALADIGATSTVMGRIDVATSTRLATAGYTAPDNAGIGAIQDVTDKVEDTLEDDGGTYRFTTNALEQAPVGGGGGGTDWTADEKTAIRTILGIPASGTTPEVPSAGALKVIDDLIDNEVGTLLTTTADTLAAVDTEIGAIKTVVDAIKVQTDKMVFTIANKLDVSIQAAADITTAVANKLADHIWRRNYSNIRASANGDSLAFRSPLGGISKLVNKWFFDSGDLVLTHEDDSTEFGRQATTTSSSAEPITSLDTE